MPPRRGPTSNANMPSMCKSIKTAIAACVRMLIPLVRLAERYFNLKANSPEQGIEPSLIFLFDSGYATTLSGWGKMFDEFCRFKHLGKYTGRNVRPRSPDDPDYTKSRLQILPFDHAFKLIKSSITDNEFYMPARDRVLPKQKCTDGEHGIFKPLDQPDDFDDDLGLPLHVQGQDEKRNVHIDNDADSDDLHNQFDEVPPADDEMNVPKKRKRDEIEYGMVGVADKSFSSIISQNSAKRQKKEGSDVQCLKVSTADQTKTGQGQDKEVPNSKDELDKWLTGRLFDFKQQLLQSMKLPPSTTNGEENIAMNASDYEISTVDFRDMLKCENNDKDSLFDFDLLSVDMDKESIDELVQKLNEVCGN